MFVICPSLSMTCRHYQSTGTLLFMHVCLHQLLLNAQPCKTSMPQNGVIFYSNCKVSVQISWLWHYQYLSGWSIELLMSYILLHLIVGIYGIWEFGNQEWSQRSPNFMNTSYVAYNYKLLIPPQVSIYGNHLFFLEREGRRWGCVCCVSRCFHTQWLCQDLTLQVGYPFLCTITLSWPYECIVSNNDLYSVCMFSRLVNLQRLVYF